MNRRRYKTLLLTALGWGCLFEAVGCPQVFGNALIQGTRSFLETGLTTVFLEAFDFEALLGL